VDIVEERVRACLASENGSDSSGGTRGGYRVVSIPRTVSVSVSVVISIGIGIGIGSSSASSLSLSASSRHHGPVVVGGGIGTDTDQSHPAVRQPEHHDRDRRGRQAGFGRGDCYGRGHGVVYDGVF